MTDTPEDDKQAAEKREQAAAKQRHQENLQRVLEQKRQREHEAHQHHAAKPKFSPKFSPSPIRRGPRGG